LDFYSFFKFLHVLTAIAWVGGGLTLLASNMIQTRAKGEAAVLDGLEVMNGLGKAWFVPMSLLTVVFGAVATTMGGLWSDMWVVLGLLGFAWTFFTGLLFIEPQGRKLAQMLESGDRAGAIAAGQRMMSIARFDYTVMLVIIADMVLKPQWSDIAMIVVFVAVLAAAAMTFLVPAFRAQPEAA
jgi:hypothetical protein